MRPSVWTIPCRYMAVEGFKMVTTHAHPPPPQHTAVGAGGRWWWCGLFLGWVWCSETPRSVVPSPLPLHTPSSRPSYVPPPPVSLAPNTHTHTTSLPVRVLLVVCVPSLSCACLFSSDSPPPSHPLPRAPTNRPTSTPHRTEQHRAQHNHARVWSRCRLNRRIPPSG